VTRPSPALQLVIHEYGDAALLVDLVAESYEDRWRATQNLGRGLREAGLPGVIDVVATYENVVVSFDPLTADGDAIREAIGSLGSQHPAERAASRFVIPVAYGGEAGPDLDQVASELGMEPEAVVDLHTSSDWTVRFRGSPVAAPFVDGPRLPAPVARRREPRVSVPAGSVALSGYQSVIYSASSPGGWRLIGRTPLELFSLTPPHVAYLPGDSIRFRRIDASAWSDYHGALLAEGSP
jgi:KipI family sensor histidine kinase inhibitor